MKGVEPKTVDLNDGLHIGKVVRLEQRTPEGKDYTYLDVFIVPSGEVFEIKQGYNIPKNGVSSKTDLGKLIGRFKGRNIIPNESYDLNELLINRVVQFVTIKNQEGFVDINKESLKPSENQDQIVEASE